jgi:uncharacterized UPF0160 family protein
MKKIVILFALLFGLFYGYLFGNPYHRVLRADRDLDNASYYLTLYWHLLSREKAVQLFKRLVVENNDVQTMLVVSFFCKDHQICELVDDLNQDVKLVQAYPTDTVWIETIRPHYRRITSRKAFLNETTLKTCSELTIACERK